MVKTRAQRVANEEQGVAQSPPQRLDTPHRKKKNDVGTTMNQKTKNAKRNNESVSDSDGQSKTKATKPAQAKKIATKTGAKKSRLRIAAEKARSQVTNDIVLPNDESDGGIDKNQENVPNGAKRGRDVEEDDSNSKAKRAKTATQTTRPTRANTNSKEESPTSNATKLAAPITQQTNGGLFSLFSRLSPNRPVAQSQAVDESTQTSRQGNSTTKAKSLEQPKKALTQQKKASNEPYINPLSAEGRARSEKLRKAYAEAQRLKELKRKRDAGEPSHDWSSFLDLDDEPDKDAESKKTTANWSFKPDKSGLYSLYPRNRIDPKDDSIIFVEGEEAAKLISAEFERKKQVRFADRIAKQFPELTPEERAAHAKDIQALSLSISSQDVVANAVARNADMRAIARRLESGNQTLSQKIEALTTSGDEELRKELVEDLLDLVQAIRSAGPQSQSISPVDQDDSPFKESQGRKRTTASPEEHRLQITAGPDQASTSTPGRIFASLRKFPKTLTSYLPFGASGSESSHDSSANNAPMNNDLHEQGPESPTPSRYINHDQPMNKRRTSEDWGNERPDAPRDMSHTQPHDQPQVKVKTPENSKTSHSTLKSIPPNASKFQQTPSTGNRNMLSKSMTDMPKTPNDLKRKIGSEAYPLTANGKIPRPSANSWGMNDDYFYGADSDTSTEEEEEEEVFFPKPKRARYEAKLAAEKKEAEEMRSLSKISIPRVSPSSRPSMKKPAARAYTAPELSSSEEETQAQTVSASVVTSKQEKPKTPTAAAKSFTDAHRPKTPSRLREVATAPDSPINMKARLEQYFTGKESEGALNAFARI